MNELKTLKQSIREHRDSMDIEGDMKYYDGSELRMRLVYNDSLRAEFINKILTVFHNDRPIFKARNWDEARHTMAAIEFFLSIYGTDKTQL